MSQKLFLGLLATLVLWNPVCSNNTTSGTRLDFSTSFLTDKPYTFSMTASNTAVLGTIAGAATFITCAYLYQKNKKQKTRKQIIDIIQRYKIFLEHYNSLATGNGELDKMIEEYHKTYYNGSKKIDPSNQYLNDLQIALEGVDSSYNAQQNLLPQEALRLLLIAKVQLQVLRTIVFSTLQNPNWSVNKIMIRYPRSTSGNQPDVEESGNYAADNFTLTNQANPLDEAQGKVELIQQIIYPF